MAGPDKSPRPKPRPSLGQRVVSGIKAAGSQIKSDFQHATGSKPYTGDALKSYNDRTAASRAAHEKFLEQSRRNDRGSSPRAALNTPEEAGPAMDSPAMRYNRMMRGVDPSTGGIASLQAGTPETPPAPQPPQITPEMRQAALGMFESQQGAGQVPYYMAAARNAQNPNMSPAFQYAAQNYDMLGGSQRLAPRPMEMMSVAERRQINDMSQAMADQQAAANEYQAGMDMVLRGGGKGGPRTGPQMPQGQPMMPQTGGGMPRPPLPFASMLAQRFGRM